MLRRVLISAIVLLFAAGPAGAGTIVAKLALTPGKLAVAASPAQAASGATVAVPVKVADGRGTGKGWTLHFADASRLTVIGITARCASNSTCTLPVAAGAPSGTTVLRALHDTGMGIVDLVVTVRASATAKVAFTVS
jgi:hypothetical protein